MILPQRPTVAEAILRRLAGRCEMHDRPSAWHIAVLEATLGVRPAAYAEFEERLAGVAERYYDPEMLDCGHGWCSKNLASGYRARRRRDADRWWLGPVAAGAVVLLICLLVFVLAVILS